MRKSWRKINHTITAFIPRSSSVCFLRSEMRKNWGMFFLRRWMSYFSYTFVFPPHFFRAKILKWDLWKSGIILHISARTHKHKTCPRASATLRDQVAKVSAIRWTLKSLNIQALLLVKLLRHFWVVFALTSYSDGCWFKKQQWRKRAEQKTAPKSARRPPRSHFFAIVVRPEAKSWENVVGSSTFIV